MLIYRRGKLRHRQESRLSENTGSKARIWLQGLQMAYWISSKDFCWLPTARQALSRNGHDPWNFQEQPPFWNFQSSQKRPRTSGDIHKCLMAMVARILEDGRVCGALSSCHWSHTVLLYPRGSRHAVSGQKGKMVRCLAEDNLLRSSQVMNQSIISLWGLSHFNGH